jgi:hypothetical protein
MPLTSRCSLCVVALLLFASSAAAETTKRQCISANEAGQDLRRAGKLSEAADRFAFCAAEQCPRLLREDCANRLEEARRTIPTVIFVVKDGAGHAVANVKVTMDGAPLGRLDGSALGVEPGTHSFEFSAEGYQTKTTSLVLREGVKGREEVISLQPSSITTGSGDGRRVSNDVAPTDERRNEDRGLQGSDSSRRMLAYVLGGIGTVGIGVGLTFGVLAKVAGDDAKDRCPVPSVCNDDGALADGEAAHDRATVSTIAVVTGAVLLAGGIVVFLMSAKSGGASAGAFGVPRTPPELGVRW